jgi:hypothetical protein
MGGAGIRRNAFGVGPAPVCYRPTIKDRSGTSKTRFHPTLPSSPEDIYKPAGLQCSVGQRIAENSMP